MEAERLAPSPEQVKGSDRSMAGYIVFVAIRCTLQYIVFPFLLPFIGLSGSISLILSLLIDVFALGMIVYNIRRLWNTSWRWRYVALSVVMISILAVFMVEDVRLLFA
ncbi:MAG: hypothetical protein KF821_06890 [Anaerolineales bacterium]|nr:hypothetical protein [Anaerolineales bacterium]MBX3005539.1 hypothetical protein [Anaerolineales bacterium]